MSSDAAESSSSSSSTIQLDQISLADLDQLQQNEEGRLQALTQRFAQLRQAAARLHQSSKAVEQITPASDNKEILLPLTESVYVPGRIKEPTKLLVDIGTGFYVEKTSKETTQYLERKLRIVDANSDNITKAVEATRSNVQAIHMTMQGKMLEIRAKQEGMKHREAVES
jgi:prefoldin alpha subunit